MVKLRGNKVGERREFKVREFKCVVFFHRGK